MPSRRLIAFAAAAALLAGCGRTAGPQIAADAEDMSLGAPNARVRVIEYASASCTHCARFAIDVFPAFKAKYIDAGKVSFTLKEYLTDPRVMAAGGFLLARCAGRDRYFPVLDAVYRAQGEMLRTGDLKSGLSRIAKSPGGLTDAQFTACMQDVAAEKALVARVARHRDRDGVAATPTFVINGRRFEGAMTLPELDAAIARAES